MTTKQKIAIGIGAIALLLLIPTLLITTSSATSPGLSREHGSLLAPPPGAERPVNQTTGSVNPAGLSGQTGASKTPEEIALEKKHEAESHEIRG